MEENGYRFGVGVLVLASALVGLLLVVFFGAVPQIWKKHYTVTINFQSAPGVGSDTPVRKNGVQIGRVSSVELIRDAELELDETTTNMTDRKGGVNLVLELDQDIVIRQGELCRIGAGSIITGDHIVEFVLPTKNSLLDRFDGLTGTPKNGILEQEERAIANSILKNGDYLKGGIVQADPMQLMGDLGGNFASTLTSIERAAQRIDSLALTFQNVVGGSSDNIQAVVEKTKTAVDNFNRTADSIQRVLNQIENSPVPDALAKALEKVPAIFDEAELVVKQTRQTLKSFEEVGTNFQEVGETANSTLKNIEEFTAPLKGEGGRVVDTAVVTLENLGQLSQELRVFSQRLNNGQGTIAKLIDDDQMYFSVLRSLENIERVTQRLEPIVNDARAFTDKVARDPSSIVNIRGVLNGRPSGLGIK